MFTAPAGPEPGARDLPGARSPSPDSSKASPLIRLPRSSSISTTRSCTPAAFLFAINDSLDASFSKPKRIARALIAFHQARGATIVFVTSRYPSQPSSDRTSRLLQRLFKFSAPPPVLFTAQRPKADAIRSVHPALS